MKLGFVAAIFFTDIANESNRQNTEFQEAIISNGSTIPFTMKLSNYIQLGLIFVS